MPPTPDSISSVFYLSFYVLFALVLLELLRRRDRSRSALLDAALLALAGAVPTVLILIQPYMVSNTYPVLGRAVQIAVSLSDVILAALFLRLVAARGRRSPAYLLLLAAVPFYLASDFIWNWFTLLGAYSPGSWGDSGWLLCFTLTGAASLHPSMARLDEAPTMRSQGLGRFLVFLFGVALLISPGLHLAEYLFGRDLSSLPVVALLTGISVLVLARVADVVRSSERLRFELGEQNNRMFEVAAIVNSTEDSVIGAAIDGTVRSWNPASEQLYGYTASEIIGRPIHTIAEPSRHRLVDEALEALARGKAIARHEATGVRKDGAIIPVALTVSAIRDGAGVVVGSSTIARDISVLRAAQGEREALLGELAGQNERLIALDRIKDEFVASVSHELRTPLTSIRGYLGRRSRSSCLPASRPLPRPEPCGTRPSMPACGRDPAVGRRCGSC